PWAPRLPPRVGAEAMSQSLPGRVAGAVGTMSRLPVWSVGGLHSRWMSARGCARRPCLLAAFALSLQALSAGRGFAHAGSPGSPPLAPTPLRLKYWKPAEIVALFARERLPGSTGDRTPRAARSDEEESLVPPGVDAVLQTGDAEEVVLVGTEGVPD